MHPFLRILLGLIGAILLLPGACGVILLFVELNLGTGGAHMPASDVEFIVFMLALAALGVWLLVSLRRK